MKKLFTILLALFVAFSAAAQSEKSIILDQNSFRPIHSSALDGVNIDPIGIDSSRNPCARIKVKINRMSREDIDKIEVKIHTNNNLTKCKTADYDNGLIIEMTAKSETKFYFYHPDYGYSNEVVVNLEPDKEFYLEASLNKTYSIVVNSNVPDAEVYIDGKFISRTDLNNSCIVKDVLIGMHDLKLVYGNLTYNKQIEVNSSSISFTQNVDTAATESQFVVFIVNPSNAIVMIGNQPYSLQDGAMMEVLAAGTYNYTVTAAGYHSQSGTFSVAGEKVEKHITLTADSAFVLLTAPDNAEIWINGTKRGNGTWRGTLNSGNYIFEARKAGHKSSKISQYIASNNAHQSFDLPAPTPIVGSLVVSGTPIAAEVTLDGKSIGTMPIKKDKLLVGSHTLTISKSGYQTETRTITIAEGKTTTENVALKKVEVQTQNQNQDKEQSSSLNSSSGYNVGDLVNVNGVFGVVCQTSPVLKVVSAAEGYLKWSTENKTTKADGMFSGKTNLSKIKSIPGWKSKYPAFEWCASLGEGWSLPSIDELKVIYNAKEKINSTLQSIQMPVLGAKGGQYPWLWSSTEKSYDTAYYLYFSNGATDSYSKSGITTFRAIFVADISTMKHIRLEKRYVANSSSTSVKKESNSTQNNATTIKIDTSLSASTLNTKGWEYYNKKDYNAAAQYFYESAKKGSADSQVMYGYCCGNGLGVTKNFTEAFNWYYKAAEGGHKVGQFNLGILYEFGNGVTQNYNEAAKWYRKSAEQGYAHAQCSLGYCYEKGNGVSQNDAQAYYWYKKAAEQGFDTAQYNLGQCYRVARGTSKDITEAIKWYLKSAEQGYEDAKTRLSELGITPITIASSLTSDQLNDKGVEYHNNKNYSAAFQYYLKAIEKGNMYSQYNLGLLFQYGLGVAKDLDEAVKMYKKSAEQGYADAQCNLGYCYENGNGVSQNDAQAYYWYKKAAEQGLDRAQYNLGQCYRVTRGVSKDITEAIKWYLKAADQGYENAKTRLSELGITPIKVDASLTAGQLNDKGVEYHNNKNYSAAFQYYLKAIEKGNMYSQYNLGLLFQYGLGVTADTTEAVKWYRKSSNQGYEEAKKKIKELGY